MARVAQVVGRRRPRAGVMIAVGVVALGAGGVGWATVASGVFTLGAGSVPLEVYFSCKRGAQLDDVWSHPTIDVESATSPHFHQTVGPALPKKPRIGPGPIHKVFGTE
jgi:hypothetical protein